MDNAPNVRPFWSKPEGVTGGVFLGVSALAAIAAVALFGPFLLGVLGTAISLVGQAIVLGALSLFAFLGYLLVTSKTVHTFTSVLFKSVMRKLTNFLVVIDPIGIMKNYVSELRKKRDIMQDNIRKLSSQRQVVMQKILENKRNADNALKTAAAAQKQGKANVMTVQAKQAGRLKDYTLSLEDVLAKIELLLKMLGKYDEAAEAVILDLTNEVSIQEDKRKTMFAAYGAMTAAREIISGGGDQRELFNMTMEHVKDSYAEKLGEIENFMTASKSFIDGMDVQNGVFEADALKQIAEWETNVDSLVLGDKKRQIIEQHNTVATLPVFTTPISNNDYSKLFNR